MNRNYIDITGQQFGRLVVLKRVGTDQSKNILWLCECECGNRIITRGTNLRKGNTKSCGCLRKEKSSKRIKKGILITFDGKTQNLAGWAKELKIAYSTLHNRLAKGWSVEKAFTTSTHNPAHRARMEELLNEFC